MLWDSTDLQDIKEQIIKVQYKIIESLDEGKGNYRGRCNFAWMCHTASVRQIRIQRYIQRPKFSTLFNIELVESLALLWRHPWCRCIFPMSPLLKIVNIHHHFSYTFPTLMAWPPLRRFPSTSDTFTRGQPTATTIPLSSGDINSYFHQIVFHLMHHYLRNFD